MEPIELGGEPPAGWESATYAKEQPEYLALPCFRTAGGRVMSRWRPTPEERVAIAEGADIFLTVLTFREPLQPVTLEVGREPPAAPLVADVVNRRRPL